LKRHSECIPNGLVWGDINWRVLVTLLFFFLLFSGCSQLFQRVGDPSASRENAEARKLISEIRGINSGLMTFKGIGKATLRDGDRYQTARIAWVGAFPDKILFKILGSGQPVTSVASDGSRLFIVSHATGDFHKYTKKDASLKNVLSVPVKVSDVVAFLAGKIPICKYRSAEISIGGSDDVLNLINVWGVPREKIYLDPVKTTPYKMEKFDATGSLLYRVEFFQMNRVGEYLIPGIIEVSDEDSLFRLRIERAWTDVPVDAETFVLTSPK
jgi:hypothetical protein